MKGCNIEGCLNPQFGGGYCRYHQFKRKMKGGDLYKPKPRQKSPLPKESKKREKERIYYLDQVKMFWKECVENGNDFCFFCGQKMTKREDTHHLKGRIGDYYLDKKWWIQCHRECHGAVHDWSVEKLMSMPWYQDYLARLKAKDESLYWKALKKEDKSELFD